MEAIMTQRGQFQISYHRDGDVLYISIGSPRPSLTFEDEQGLLLRRDKDTGELTGVTILDYAEHFSRLSDLSWLDGKALPEELIAYLTERPSFLT